MSKPRLYVEGPLAAGEFTTLPSGASHHLCKVLRHLPGDELILFNGDGFNYVGVLENSGKQATVNITLVEKNASESMLNLHLLQGVSRGDRMDASLQKSVELGVTSITPLLCEKSQVKLKPDRLEKKNQHWLNVIIAACEQSGRSIVPSLNPPMTLQEWFTSEGIRPTQSGLVFDPMSTTLIGDADLQHSHCHLVIGPESGLTANEIHYCLDNGCSGTSLGPRILRTETAGPAAIAILQSRYGDLHGVK